MWFKRLRRQPRLLTVLTTVSALAIACAYFQLATPMYVSTARIHIKPSTDGPQPSVVEYVALVTDRLILKRVRGDPNMLTLIGSATPNYLNELEAALVATAECSNVMQVSASSPYPEDAAKFVNAVVRSLLEFLEEETRKSTTAVLEIANPRLEDLRRALEEKREELRLFPEKHSELVNPPAARADEALERLEQELWEARSVVGHTSYYYDTLRGLETDSTRFRTFVEENETRIAAVAGIEIETEDGVTESEADYIQRRLSLAEDLLDAARCAELEAECNQLAELIAQAEARPPLEGKIAILEWAAPASKPSRPHTARILGLAAYAGLVAAAVLVSNSKKEGEPRGIES